MKKPAPECPTVRGDAASGWSQGRRQLDGDRARRLWTRSAQWPPIHLLLEAVRANPRGLLGPQRLRHLDEAFGERSIPSKLFRRRSTHVDAGGGRGARVDRGGDRAGGRAAPASLAARVATRKKFCGAGVII